MIIAIDPSYANPCGIVVWDDTIVIHAEAITHDKAQSERERIHRVADLTRGLVEQWRPSILAIEEPPYVKDAHVHFSLSRLVGVIEYACRDVPCILVKPTQAKQALTGKGNATKDQMVRFAQQVYLTRWEFRTKSQEEAVADAVGIALAADMLQREQRYLQVGNRLCGAPE